MMNNTQTIHYLVMLQDKNLLNYNPDTKKIHDYSEGKKVVAVMFWEQDSAWFKFILKRRDQVVVLVNLNSFITYYLALADPSDEGRSR